LREFSGLLAWITLWYYPSHRGEWYRINLIVVHLNSRWFYLVYEMLSQIICVFYVKRQGENEENVGF